MDSLIHTNRKALYIPRYNVTQMNNSKKSWRSKIEPKKTRVNVTLSFMLVLHKSLVFTAKLEGSVCFSCKSKICDPIALLTYNYLRRYHFSLNQVLICSYRYLFFI